MPSRATVQKRIDNGQCSNCGKPADQSKCSKCLTEHRSYIKGWTRAQKVSAIGHYGGVCACCGERELAFLTIDHIDGGGTKHRQEVGGGSKFYRWLITNEFPSGYQVLCANCNTGRLTNGGVCPHKQQGVAQ